MIDRADTHSQPDGDVMVPWELVVPEAEIYLVGYGMRVPNDFTLEMLAILKQCRRAFGVPALDAPAFGVPKMESLLHLYAPDKNRAKTYREMVTTVLDAAAVTPPVAFATYGSAMVGTLPTHMILQEAPRRGLRVHVANTVSSFDGIWADFNIEPFFGFQIWEATVFVALGIQPDLAAHLLLPQAPVFEVEGGPDTTGEISMQSSSTIAKLRDHLLRFYPANHEIHFVKTGSGSGGHGMRSIIETVRLKDLDRPGTEGASTLLVPRLEEFKRRGVVLDFDAPATVPHVMSASTDRVDVAAATHDVAAAM
jgi:uncharacterized protein YabN with tetrapyrrole methylase and pyrophosphatase domain